jgi:hypothetical protein
MTRMERRYRQWQQRFIVQHVINLQRHEENRSHFTDWFALMRLAAKKAA